MEFNEKLQELRKQKGMTQEELAAAIFVSRTAVSKWESGRGYPSIESLKAIASYFSVTVDELLSQDQLLSVAEEDGKRRIKYCRDLIFGSLDISALLLLVLPLFAERGEGGALSVSLLSLAAVNPYLKTVLMAFVITLGAFGVLTLALQNFSGQFWIKSKAILSFAIGLVLALLLTLSLHPYAAVFILLLLILKGILLVKMK